MRNEKRHKNQIDIYRWTERVLILQVTIPVIASTSDWLQLNMIFVLTFAFLPSCMDLCMLRGRRGGLMVSALDSGASAPGSSPGRGHCVVFLGKTLYSHGASLHPGV